MFKLVYHMAFEQTVVGLYDEVATFLNIFQTAAILEVSQVIIHTFYNIWFALNRIMHSMCCCFFF